MAKSNTKNANNLGFLSTLIIITKSILVCIKYCIITIALSFRKKKYKREDIDKEIRIWSRKILSYTKANIRVNNAETVKYEQKPYILMSNHNSLYDIPLIYYAMPGSIRMIAKAELFKIPLFSTAMRRNDIISIDRSNRTKASASLNDAKQKMKNGIILWMAPVGRRSNSKELLEFKKGVFILAIETGATIYPIGIKGAHDILPAKSLRFKSHQNIEINVGEPIDATEYGLDKKEQLITRTREAILELIK